MSGQAEDAMTSVDQTLVAVEEHLKVFSESSMEEFVADLRPIEKAKVQVSLAYTINALLYVYLKTQGVSSKDIRQTHVKQELERVKAFIKKIKDAEELAKGPALKLDKGASKRMVNNALSGDQVYAEALSTRAKEEAGQGKTSEEPTKAGSKKGRTATTSSASDAKAKRRRKQ